MLIEVVAGGSPTSPAARKLIDDGSQHGRGLALVGRMAQWGSRILPGGNRSTTRAPMRLHTAGAHL
ncbi:hypothetical protein [Streptomyces mashuensis]|uniref:hypothetical protein n=1 Tax=Streptomyces mashuensis TaxID=33904 RepID=UPI00167CAA96|nr:hypothetical protein [Streptomyces mashuensis]